MKKILIIFLLLFAVKVHAYETDIYKIDIPEGYNLEETNNDILKWSKDNSYISISVDSNKEKKYDINSFDEDEIKKQSEYIENGINSGLEKYKIKAIVSDSKKIIVNNIVALEYKIYLPSEKLIGYNMYQIGRMYTTKKNIITIVYSTDKEIDEESEYKTIIDSFKIKDDPIRYENANITPFAIIIIIGTILGIIGYFVDNKKRKK